MELRLTVAEKDLLVELLEADESRLILEIARTEHRAARDVLKKREAQLAGILAALGGMTRKAS